MSAPQLRSDWPGVLRGLELNWDHDGAVQITDAAINALYGFSVVPCSDGGIQLEAHSDGFDIEICIGPKGNIESGLVCCERSALEGE